MKSLLCYTFTGKKLDDFIPYFFNDTINKNSRIFNLVKYVNIKSEQEFKSDFYNKNRNKYFDEIYVILDNKIRLHSFYKSYNEYSFCSFEDLCSLLSMSQIGELDIDGIIEYYIEEGVEYKI